MSKIFYKFLVLLVISFISFSVNAQLRHNSCGKSLSKFYVTPYIGIGMGSYSYDLNNTVIGPAPDSVNYPTAEGNMTTPIFGINFMYNVGRANIGGGLEWEGMYGKTTTEISEVKQSAYFYKFYGKLEYAFYSDSFSDIGMHLQAGIMFPNKTIGDSKELGMFVLGGFYYNLIIDSRSSLFIAADYEYSMFTTSINTKVSNHTLKPIKISIGYRFWF